MLEKTPDVTSGTRKSDLATLVRMHNNEYESDISIDLPLTGHILSHPWLRSAIKEIGSGIVVEIGPYRGVTLEQLSGQYASQLSDALVVGIDKGSYNGKPSSGKFKMVEPQALLDAEGTLGRLVFSSRVRRNSITPASIYQHDEHPNTFAVYDVAAQHAFLGKAILDLVLIKCMLGYLGNTPNRSLRYLQKTVLPRAERLFMVDYIGRCEYREMEIPAPETVAETVMRTHPNVLIQNGENYFMLYAKR